MSIGVVGSGIAGLTAAYELSRDRLVTLYEADDRLGGHTHTVSVEVGGRPFAIDTGFIVFNERTYPGFCRLLGELGVASSPTRMSFSVRNDRTGLEYGTSSLGQFFAQRRNWLRPTHHRLFGEIRRFYQRAPTVLDGRQPEVSVGDWLQREAFSADFLENHLLPLGSALWSCPHQTFLRFPMAFLVRFLVHHGMLQFRARPIWRVVAGGSSSYLESITRPFRERIRHATPIRRVRRRPDCVELEAASGEVFRHDHVVIAVHGDRALPLLSDATDDERSILGAFTYQENAVVLHTDPSVLPRRRAIWSAWNYRVPKDRTDAASVTYDMNILQGLDAAAPTFCVTLNPIEPLSPSRVLRSLSYSHPLYTVAAEHARTRHGDVLGRNRTSYCGAYWGFGFHEDGVQSGLRAAEAARAVTIP